MQPEYKYKQIYNPKSNRLQNYDYSSNGGYFITICTKNRENYFGKIVNGEIILNEYGKIVFDEINNIQIFRKNVILDAFIIMPNHIHLILFIENDCRDVSVKHLEGTLENSQKNDFINNIVLGKDVLTKHLYNKNEYHSSISPKKGTIGNIIKLFKGFSTKKIKKLNQEFFTWQPNYYDRIIRNEIELEKIRKYIVENPLKWEFDKNNEENIFM